MYVWIDSNFGRMTVSYCDFGKSYSFKLQQNHDVTVILSNSDSKHAHNLLYIHLEKLYIFLLSVFLFSMCSHGFKLRLQSIVVTLQKFKYSSRNYNLKLCVYELMKEMNTFGFWIIYVL